MNDKDSEDGIGIIEHILRVQHNKERFKLTGQLANILENSRKEMGW